MTPKKHKQSGVTLMELIIALVIISVALTAMAAAVSSMAGRSADPAIRQQAIAIANMYMAEVAAKDFGAGCPGIGNAGIARADYTEICQYNYLNETPRDQLGGNAINNLTQYTVAVAVSNPATANNRLGPAANLVPDVDTLLITVTVTGPSNTSFALTSYRTR